jgi:hypothetical protein
LLRGFGEAYLLPASVANSAQVLRAANEARKRIRRAAAAMGKGINAA